MVHLRADLKVSLKVSLTADSLVHFRVGLRVGSSVDLRVGSRVGLRVSLSFYSREAGFLLPKNGAILDERKILYAYWQTVVDNL